VTADLRQRKDDQTLMHVRPRTSIKRNAVSENTRGEGELESLRNEDAQQRARQKKGGGRGGGRERERKESFELAIC